MHVSSNSFIVTFFGKLYFLGTLNCKVENNLERNFEKNSGTYPIDIAPNVSPWYPFSSVAILVLFLNPKLDQYCNAIFIAISMAVEPLSEKKTWAIFGEIIINFLASNSDGSFVRLNNDEC